MAQSAKADRFVSVPRFGWQSKSPPGNEPPPRGFFLVPARTPVSSRCLDESPENRYCPGFVRMKVARQRYVAAICVLAGFASIAGAWRRSSTWTPYVQPHRTPISVGDLDGDRVPDTASLETGMGGSVVRLALSASPDGERVYVADESVTIASLDLDHDGDLDVLIVSGSGRSTALVLVNDGKGRFRPKDLPVENQLRGAATIGSFLVDLAAAAGSVASVPVDTQVAPAARPARCSVKRPILVSAPARALTSRGPPPALCL